MKEALRVLEALELQRPDAVLTYHLMLETGARSEEIHALLVSDVELRGDKAVVTVGRHAGARKTGARSLMLGGGIVARLQTAVASKSPGARLCLRRLALRARMEAVFKELEMERFTPMGLRYLTVQRLMDARVDAARYQAWMGHSYDVGLSIYRRPVVEELGSVGEALRAPAGEVIEGPWSAGGGA